MYKRLYLAALITIVSVCLGCSVLFHSSEDKATAAWEHAIKVSHTITPPYDETVVRAMKVADSVRVSTKSDSLDVVLHRVSENDSLFFFTYWPKEYKGIAGGNRTFAVYKVTLQFAWGLVRGASDADMIFDK